MADGLKLRHDNRMAMATSQSDGLRFACPHCSAAQQFDIKSGMLRCEHCGTRSQVPPGQGSPVPRPLAAGLSQPDPEPTELQSTRCSHCYATVERTAHHVAFSCAFCGSAQVRKEEQHQRPLRVQVLVPFLIDRSQAATHFAHWLRGLWLRPSALRHLAQLEQLSGVYVPYWLLSADVESTWSAEAGTYYDVPTPDSDDDAEGGEPPVYRVQGGATLPDPKRQQRRTRKVRWQHAEGRRRDRFVDFSVCASGGLSSALLEKLRLSQTSRLVPYAPGYLAGFSAEQYAVNLEQGWQRAQSRLQQLQVERCTADIPGDTHRGLTVHSEFSQQQYRQALLPVWIATYRYRQALYRFVISGEDGQVVGEAPYSVWKVALTCLLALALGALALYLHHRYTPEPQLLLQLLRH